MDEKGRVQSSGDDENGEDGSGSGMFENPLDNMLFNQQNLAQAQAHGAANPTKEPKQFIPVKNYKPTGNLVYSADMFDKLEKKVGFGSGGGGNSNL